MKEITLKLCQHNLLFPALNMTLTPGEKIALKVKVICTRCHSQTSFNIELSSLSLYTGSSISIDAKYQLVAKKFGVWDTSRAYWGLTRCGPFVKICFFSFWVTSSGLQSLRRKGYRSEMRVLEDVPPLKIVFSF